MTSIPDDGRLDDGGVASPARASIGDAVRARLDRNPMVSRIDAPNLDIYGRQAFLSAEECAGLRTLLRRLAVSRSSSWLELSEEWDARGRRFGKSGSALETSVISSRLRSGPVFGPKRKRLFGRLHVR